MGILPFYIKQKNKSKNKKHATSLVEFFLQMWWIENFLRLYSYAGPLHTLCPCYLFCWAIIFWTCVYGVRVQLIINLHLTLFFQVLKGQLSWYIEGYCIHYFRRRKCTECFNKKEWNIVLRTYNWSKWW